MATNFLLSQMVDEINNNVPEHPLTLINDCMAECQGPMGFPGACYLFNISGEKSRAQKCIPLGNQCRKAFHYDLRVF